MASRPENRSDRGPVPKPTPYLPKTTEAGPKALSHPPCRIFVVNNVAMRLRGWIPIILICTPVVSRLGSADRQAPDPRAWGTTTSHPHVEASRQARVIRTADTGEGPWPSSGTSAETGEQQGLGVRMAGHRRPLGDSRRHCGRPPPWIRTRSCRTDEFFHLGVRPRPMARARSHAWIRWSANSCSMYSLPGKSPNDK